MTGTPGQDAERAYAQQGAYNPKAVAGKAGQGAADMVLIHSSTNYNTTVRNLDDAASLHPGGSSELPLYGDGSVHFYVRKHSQWLCG